MFLNKHFASDDDESTTHGWPRNLSVRSAASITSLFGQHPSHGVTGLPSDRSGSQTKCVDVVLAAFFTAGVFVLAIVSMQYVSVCPMYMNAKAHLLFFIFDLLSEVGW